MHHRTTPLMTSFQARFLFCARQTAFLAVVFAFISPVKAAQVTKVKEDQAQVEADPTDPEFNVGDRFFVMSDGKKRAAIVIVKAKGRRGIAKVLKGKPEVGGTLAAVGAKSDSSTSAATQDASEAKKPRRSKSGPLSKTTVGVLGGLNSATQAVTITNATTSSTVSTAGMGYSLKGFADFPISGGFGATSRLGLEQFNVSGSSASTQILYATADFLLRYNFLSGSFQPSLNTGLGIHFPISKSSNDLDPSLISSTTVLYFGAGFDYIMSNTMYLRLNAEYSFFPPSNNVKTTLMALRFGVGWTY